jgi:hypothetical protein
MDHDEVPLSNALGQSWGRRTHLQVFDTVSRIKRRSLKIDNPSLPGAHD